MNRMFYTRLGAAAIIFALGTSGQADAAPPPPPTPTIWNYLGIPQTFHKFRDVTSNRRGNRPGAERTDPLRRIADPANLDSPDLAVKTAAKIKADQDLAPQKIKAIKFLGTVGCGCYTGVKEALMDSLDSCTEEVRYEAAVALCHVAGNSCNHCGNTCCNAEVMQKLHEKAYGQDEKGCCKEASARVRAAAEMALNACRNKVGATTQPGPGRGPEEGPRKQGEPTPAIPAPKASPVTPPTPSAASEQPLPATVLEVPSEEAKPSITLRILPESGERQDPAVRQATATEPAGENR